MAETAPNKGQMTVDDFIAWAIAQPSGRYELLDGEVYAMSPERVGHARAKVRAWRELDRAIAARGLACEALPDGLSVPINETTTYELDVVVRCGALLDAEAVQAADPVIIVEVNSPSSTRLDSGSKLVDYFSLPSLAHYLVINASRRAIVHHARDGAGAIRTSIHQDGRLTLDPPAIEIDVAACFPEPDPA
jgi:Uma2 family endonuclease